MLTRIQHAGRWSFLRVEAAYNRAFDKHLNPFYHLNAITFFLF